MQGWLMTTHRATRARRHMKEKENETTNGAESIFGDLIHSYSRAQAIEDGVLVEVDVELARKVGFTIPIALTYAAWASCIPVPDHLKDDPEQSETGRMTDLLRVLRFNIRNRTTRGQEQVDFQLALQQPGGGHQPLKLKAICGPGDDPRPVLTILLPDED